MMIYPVKKAISKEIPARRQKAKNMFGCSVQIFQIFLTANDG